MTNRDAHRNHPFRQSDASTLVILACAIIGFALITVTSWIVALGSGLGSTPDTPVPHEANVMWMLSGYAFLPAIALAFAVLITRKQIFGAFLGLLLMAAVVLMTIGLILNREANSMDSALLRRQEIVIIAIVLAAGSIILRHARKLNG